jgi:hypothetical protein
VHSVAELTRAVDRLVRRVAHWEPPRWAATVAGGRTSRGELLHALVQYVADQAADAEGTHHRTVPRLDNDRALPDQLRVVAGDLAAAGPPPDVLAEAAAAIDEAHRLL